MSLLEAEERELAIAEKVLRRMEGGAEAPHKREAMSTKAVANDGGAQKSQRAYLLEGLEAAETPWVTSGELLSLIQERWGARLPATSVRPLLTLLRNEGLIVRDNRRIALAKRTRTGARRA